MMWKWSYQVKLDDRAERNFANFRMHLSERGAVSFQSLDDSEQGPIDRRPGNLPAENSFLSGLRFFAFSVVNEFGVVTEDGDSGEVLPGGSSEVEGDRGRGLGPGVDLSDVVVQPDVSHGRLVLRQGAGFVAKKNWRGTWLKIKR